MQMQWKAHPQLKRIYVCNIHVICIYVLDIHICVHMHVIFIYIGAYMYEMQLRPEAREDTLKEALTGD